MEPSFILEEAVIYLEGSESSDIFKGAMNLEQILLTGGFQTARSDRKMFLASLKNVLALHKYYYKASQPALMSVSCFSSSFEIAQQHYMIYTD